MSTDRAYVHVDPATGVADPDDLGDGADGSGDNVLHDDGSWSPETGGSGAPDPADYLTGSAQAGLSAEIAVGTTPGGELGGTWPSPTVDATHSGSAHHAEDHVLATDTALGAHHTITGGVAGYVLRALTATTAKFMQLVHADLGSVGVNDHHNRDHAATHGPAAADALKLDDTAAPDDNTDNDVSSAKHGLMSKLPGGTANYYREDGTWHPPSGSGAPADADYLVGTANGSLSAEIPVGTTPGGELGGTWASPTVDATHSGSAHPAATEADLGGDVSMPSAATWYDGPSASLAAGTWVIGWSGLFQAGGASLRSPCYRLTDGTTEYGYAEAWVNQNGFRISQGGTSKVVLGSTTTIKVQLRSDQATNTISRDGGNGAAHHATHFIATRIA